MRFYSLILAAAFALSAASTPGTALAQSSAPARTVARATPFEPGMWMLGFIVYGDTSWVWMTLRVAGDSVHGEMGRPPRFKVHGVVRGDSVELVQHDDSSRVRGRFRTVRRDGRIVGTCAVNGTSVAPPSDTLPCFAIRTAERAGPPRSITFEPTQFHRRFSGAIAPALRIFPGDTVKTRTVDAGGTDWNGKKRSNGGNPETGPFYVEGAMPGDVVAIKLHKVRLNRDFAVAGSSIMNSALVPGTTNGMPQATNFNSRWKLDIARGVATLMEPTKAMARYEIPLRPMMGCIAVAPAQKQSVRTQDSGPFGGNMDYNELREGTTIYLAVNEPGALVFVGDGHAAQGDGELTGDALETSMDVEFSVDIIRDVSIGGPRAENSEYLMSIGIAGDLQEALRLATSDMTRWLAADYKLNVAELASILGTAMRYDVADMVGTQMSIVAKIPRSVLAKLQKTP